MRPLFFFTDLFVSFDGKMFNAAVLTQRLHLKGEEERSHRKYSKQLDSASSNSIPLNRAKSLEEGEGSKSSLLNVSLRIQERSECGKEAVFYREDEDRFTQECCMKLKISTLYDVRIEVDEEEMLVNFSVGGKTYNCFNMFTISGCENVAFDFVWSTDNIETTKRNHRSVLPCTMRFKGRREVKFNLLAKFYEYYDARLCVGNPLLSLIHI